MLFEVPLDKIEGLTVRKETHLKKEREELYLQFDCGEIARIHVSNIAEFEKAIREAVGKQLKKEILIPHGHISLTMSEKIIREEKLWYLFSAQGILSETWKPGRLYITNKRLFWVYRVDNQKILEVPLYEITGISVTTCMSVPGVKAGEKVLSVAYDGKCAFFYGKVEKLCEIESAIQDIFPKPMVQSL